VAATNLQGVLVSAIKSGFNDILNTDPDHTGTGYQVNFYHPIIDIEPEMFRSKGTTTASITFKEQKCETNVDTATIQILYEIYTDA